MKRIIFVIDTLQSGGAERVVCSLSNGLTRKGYHVSILLMSQTDSKHFYDIDKLISLICLSKCKKMGKLKKIFALRKFMKNNMDAIYISFLPHICIYTYLSSLFLKVRFILSERSDPQQYSLFYKFLLKKAFKKAKFSVFQSIGAQKFYFKNGTNLGEVIFNPVNLDDINILEIIGKKRKKEKKIFSVGRLMKEKNFKLLIDSFILFSEVFPDYTLEIFGEGPLENDLTRYIIDKNLIGKVVLKGVSKEWHKLCRNYSCYVCSSNFEGMSNSLEEAACMGVPCVSTNCPPGGNAELLNNGEFGLLVPPSNVELLSKAMIDIIEQDISFNYEKLFSLCSSNHVLEKWITIIEGVENCG